MCPRSKLPILGNQAFLAASHSWSVPPSASLKMELSPCLGYLRYSPCVPHPGAALSFRNCRALRSESSYGKNTLHRGLSYLMGPATSQHVIDSRLRMWKRTWTSNFPSWLCPLSSNIASARWNEREGGIGKNIYTNYGVFWNKWMAALAPDLKDFVYSRLCTK